MQDRARGKHGERRLDEEREMEGRHTKRRGGVARGSLAWKRKKTETGRQSRGRNGKNQKKWQR